MPTTGRHSSFRRQINRRNDQSDNQLYPQLPPAEIEMVDMEEQRASHTILCNILQLTYTFFLVLNNYSFLIFPLDAHSKMETCL